jgi:hypothetical protein
MALRESSPPFHGAILASSPVRAIYEWGPVPNDATDQERIFVIIPASSAWARLYCPARGREIAGKFPMMTSSTLDVFPFAFIIQ